MTDLKIIGQVWADRYPEKFADPDPPTPNACIICGDPKGSCTPDHGGN